MRSPWYVRRIPRGAAGNAFGQAAVQIRQVRPSPPGLPRPADRSARTPADKRPDRAATDRHGLHRHRRTAGPLRAACLRVRGTGADRDAHNFHQYSAHYGAGVLGPCCCVICDASTTVPQAHWCRPGYWPANWQTPGSQGCASGHAACTPSCSHRNAGTMHCAPHGDSGPMTSR